MGEEFKWWVALWLGVVFIAAVFIGTMVLVDQKTDARIVEMVKSGVDPGKAVCSMRTYSSAQCTLILSK